MAEYSEYKNEGIWQHFLREKHEQSAKCRLCKSLLKTVGGSTKGLHEHLGSVRGGKAQEKLMCHLGRSISCGPNELIRNYGLSVA